MTFSVSAGLYERVAREAEDPSVQICQRHIGLLKVKIASENFSLTETWEGQGADGFGPPDHRGTCVAKIETNPGNMDFDRFEEYRDTVKDYAEDDAKMDEILVVWVENAFE